MLELMELPLPCFYLPTVLGQAVTEAVLTLG
jgi:hypothetical protein